MFLQREIRLTQQKINSFDNDEFYESAFSFSSAVIPLLQACKSIPKLSKSHFLFMIDDAQDLNTHQRETLNSWVSYRDHIDFSFKVAYAKIKELSFVTSNGGAILEGHDFLLIDMEEPYQNERSDFGKLARKIIRKRLSKIELDVSAEDFFPINSEFAADLRDCESIVRKEARLKYPNGPKKSVEDYVYKYSRAEYFRNRSSKANRPPYSGFDLIVHLSTGVIRNLLVPCYYMFDQVYSSLNEETETEIKVFSIPPPVQTDIVLEHSQRMWDRIKELDKVIQGCSREEAVQLYNLFDHLAQYFRERLFHHKSEPRAISFSISGMTDYYEKRLSPLIEVAIRAQILYTRSGPAKDSGRREPYYVPNRMLWPIRGLDPHGQHARASIKAKDLLASAVDGKKIPVSNKIVKQQAELPYD
jgi:hypothetical protein